MLNGFSIYRFNFPLNKVHSDAFQYKYRRGGVAPFFIFAACGLCLLITGFAGYEANFIQFGIDQFTDAPSEYLGLFVHWVEWFTIDARNDVCSNKFLTD